MEIDIIQNRIYEIRGQRVMLDFDLAELYATETKVLKQSVRRNANRFPLDFMFELTKEEYSSLRSQIVTLESKVAIETVSKGRGRYSKYLPFAFTEHGVTMLASVLNSERAITMNIAIVRAFIALRKLALFHTNIAMQLQELKMEFSHRIDEHDVQLQNIYDALENLLDKEAEKKEAKMEWLERERIGFKK